MPQFKAFRAQVDAGVLTVTLDDPPLNLIGPTFAEDLIALSQDAEASPAYEPRSPRSPKEVYQRSPPKLLQPDERILLRCAKDLFAFTQGLNAVPPIAPPNARVAAGYVASSVWGFFVVRMALRKKYHDFRIALARA